MIARDARTSGWVRAVIADHPIAAYLLIAFGASWAMTGLLSVSVLFGLLALFGPAVGAVVVSWAEGSGRTLRGRITDWRVAPRVYLAALGIPFGVAAAAAVAWMVAGHGAPHIGSISAIEIVIFVLVVGEEIGWRGFLLPRLRARMSLPAAALATGVVWTLWHLPIYLSPGQDAAAYAVFAAWVVPFAVVMAVIAEHARFSVAVATVMHGAANISLPIFLPGIDRTWMLLATGGLYGLLAIALIVGSRSPFPGRRGRSRAASQLTKEVAA